MAMKIFRIQPDYDFWTLAPTVQTFIPKFRLDQLRDDWNPPPFYVLDPIRTKKSDFFDIGSGAVAYNHRVYDSVVGEIIERAGEVLHATLEGTGEEFFIFNCTACYNCLDRSKTEMRLTPDGKMAIQVKKYVFHPKRIGDCSLFKIPETHRVELYALSRPSDYGDEFYNQYHALGLTGLKFEEVWSDELPPLP